MKIFILLINIWVILYIQYGYTGTISIESVDIPDELIYHFNTTSSYIRNKPQNSTVQDYEILCEINRPHYCKDDVCVCMNDTSIKPFIELPDKNGYIHRYILTTYATSYEIIISKYINSHNNETVSIDCKIDTQCFSNKCIDNRCTYNADANVERCDFIYTRPTTFTPKQEYLNCGRMIGESCSKDADCSFKDCENGRCYINHYEPSEIDALWLGLQEMGFYGTIFIIILIVIICYCCFVKRHKKMNNNNNIEKKSLVA